MKLEIKKLTLNKKTISNLNISGIKPGEKKMKEHLIDPPTKRCFTYHRCGSF